MSQERRFTLRLRYDNPEQVELIKVFENLNKEVHGSINQFLIDASLYYISHFSEAALVNGVELKRAKELMTRGEYEADREKIKEEIQLAVYQDLMKAIVGNAVMYQQKPIMPIQVESSEDKQEPKVSDSVLDDLMKWSEDD